MDNTDSLEKLNDFQEKLNQKKEEKKKLLWEKDELNKKLKDLGFKNEKEAREKLESLEGKRDSLKKQLNKKIEAFQEEYEDLLA